MKEYKLFLPNLIKVASSQVMTLAAGVVVAFLIPRVLGVTGYGFYKIYTLYFAYTSLLHFGFIDGFLLMYGGMEYEALNKVKIRTLTRFYLSFQFVMGGLVWLAGWLLAPEAYRFLWAMLGMNLFVINCTSYYQFLSQATQRFAAYSLRNMVISLSKILIAVVLALASLRMPVSYRAYLLMTSAVDFGVLCWYVCTYRGITFGKGTSLKRERNTIFALFRTGILLTLAYQVGQLIFVLDRQFVSVLFDTDTYSVYAFAYQLLTVFTTVVASFSTVLFPMMNRMSQDRAIAWYPALSAVLSCLSGLALLGYYPVEWFVRALLPEYGGSITYFRIVFPSLLLSTAISVVGFTYFKLLKENRQYFFIGLGVLFLGLVLNAGGYAWSRDPRGISWASIITLLAWYLGISLFLKRRYSMGFLRNLGYILCLLALFYCCMFGLEASLMSGGAYLAGWMAATFLFYYGNLRKTLEMVKDQT